MKVDSFRKSRSEISRSRLVNNLRALKSLQDPGEVICPMVKCNAYGHDAVLCGKWLEAEGVDALGVALVEEGIELRQGGVDDCEILVFGVMPPTALAAVQTYRLTPVVSSFSELSELAKSLSPAAALKIHLKFDTGMNRLGLKRDDLGQVKRVLADSGQRLVVTGVCSHLACAEDLGQPNGMSDEQVHRLSEFQSELGLGGVQRHLLNSTGLVARKFLATSRPEWRGWGARPGIALYGCFDDFDLLNEPAQKWVKQTLQPVMSVLAELVMIKRVEAGERVSYGGTWRAPASGLIGIAALGYGDGYPRLLSNRGTALIQNQRVPVIGRVCMDYTILDLSRWNGDQTLREGDLVNFWGDSGGRLGAVEVAQQVGTISYEILTGISRRIPRVAVD